MKKDAEEALLKAKQAEEKMKAMQVGLCEIYLTICTSCFSCAIFVRL